MVDFDLCIHLAVFDALRPLAEPRVGVVMREEMYDDTVHKDYHEWTCGVGDCDAARTISASAQSVSTQSAREGKGSMVASIRFPDGRYAFAFAV